MRFALLLAATLAPALAGAVRAQEPARAGSSVAAPEVAIFGPFMPVQRPVSEDHPGLGRLILPAPAHGDYRYSQDGGKFVVVMPKGFQLGEVARLPRNVASVASSAAGTEINVLLGAQVRTRRVKGALVIDVLDPRHPPEPGPQKSAAPAEARAAGAATAMAKPPTSAPLLGPPRPPEKPASPLVAAPASPSQSVIAATASESAAKQAVAAVNLDDAAGERGVAKPAFAAPPIANPARPAPASTATESARSVAIVPIASTEAPTILLRAEAGVGLAAFRAGAEIVVVLDAPIGFRTPGGNLDPAFSGMTTRATQDATVIHIPLGLPGTVRLSRDPKGWLVAVQAPRSSIANIEAVLVGKGADVSTMRLSASSPSRVVTVEDPQTGARLLVGTQGVPNEAVLSGRKQVQFSLLPTMQGVVLAAISDDIQLRREAGGFSIIAGPHAGGSIISSEGKADPDVPDRLPVSQKFDLPRGGPAALLVKLGETILASASAPSLAKSAPRMQVARTMVALGMGVEAQAVLDVAVTDDPALADTPGFIGLRALASILAERFDAAAGLSDPRLTGTVEVSLWRSLLQGAQGELSPADVANMAAALPLVLAYPPTLRDRVLPPILRAMALNGASGAALATLAKLPEERSLDLVRGMALEMSGDAAAALGMYDAVALRSNRLQSYTGLVRATELRMKRGDLDARRAADSLDQALYGWRRAAEELPLRIRIADLRRQVGQWPEALNMLRDARAAFPESKAEVDREIAATFTALFTGDAAQRVSPADFVALYDKNMDLVKDMSWTGQTGQKLVDRLVALELQGRAEPVMARLVAQSTAPDERALLGARLSSLRLTLDDPAGAIAALSETVPQPGIVLDPVIMNARQFMYARAESGRGNKDVAVGMLATLGTPEADEERADIHSARKEWGPMVAALSDLEHKRITKADELDGEQEAIVMRLADAATLADDNATLGRLRETYSAGMAKGSNAARFRLATSSPVHGKADLPRAFDEVQLARKLPASIASSSPP